MTTERQAVLSDWEELLGAFPALEHLRVGHGGGPGAGSHAVLVSRALRVPEGAAPHSRHYRPSAGALTRCHALRVLHVAGSREREFGDALVECLVSRANAGMRLHTLVVDWQLRRQNDQVELEARVQGLVDVLDIRR